MLKHSAVTVLLHMLKHRDGTVAETQLLNMLKHNAGTDAETQCWKLC
jgi:hypothetical protein